MKYLAVLFSLLLSFSTAALPPHVLHKDMMVKHDHHHSLSLDLYIPSDQRTDSARPTVIWIHGGAWKRGSKDQLPSKNPQLLNSVLEQGYALAAVNYRLSGEASFPAPLIDINASINHLHTLASDYHLATDNVIVMGRSAGGHLANLLGAVNRDKSVDFYGQANYNVVGVVSFFGPTDILALGKKGNKIVSERSSVAKFLGAIPSDNPTLARQASPVHYISSASPAYLLMHGAQDKRVPVTQSQQLKSKLDDAGVENTLLIEPDVGHSAAIFDSPAYVEQVMAFLQRHLPTSR